MLRENAYHTLQCAGCRRVIPDDGAILHCPDGCRALLQSSYVESPFAQQGSAHGLKRYSAVLPGNGRVADPPLPLILELPWLAQRFALPNLRVAVSGDFPKQQLVFPSGSFKDFEAAAVFARLQQRPAATLVLASAGNTALAFVAAAAHVQRQCIIVVPGGPFENLRFTEAVPPNVRFIIIPDGSYDDAIRLSQRIVQHDDFVLEGGVRNIARRDGMAVVLYRAYEILQKMPDIYVQGVGSCAGPLAIAEAARRLQKIDPAIRMPAMLLAQNLPFTPLVTAWEQHARQLTPMPSDIARMVTANIAAAVLTNTAPPYADFGGIYELLQIHGSSVHGISNAEIAAITQEFYANEHVVIDPAAACATAALRFVPEAARDADILLHITGSRSLRRVSHAGPANAKYIARRDVDDEKECLRLISDLRVER